MAVICQVLIIQSHKHKHTGEERAGKHIHSHAGLREVPTHLKVNTHAHTLSFHSLLQTAPVVYGLAEMAELGIEDRAAAAAAAERPGRWLNSLTGNQMGAQKEP